MRYIEPHAHMVSRTTDDYLAMVTAGCEAVCEPAFWAGFDRSGVQGFYDYFCQLTDYEPKRAAKFGLPHYCWLCINPKEAEDMKLAEEVISIIPEFLARPNVLGIGEIGLNKNTRNELKVLEWHIDLAPGTRNSVLRKAASRGLHIENSNEQHLLFPDVDALAWASYLEGNEAPTTSELRSLTQVQLPGYTDPAEHPEPNVTYCDWTGFTRGAPEDLSAPYGKIEHKQSST